jgi:DNA-binding transcriptional MerR regulator
VNGLTTTEAADRLGVPPTTLKTWLSMLPVPQGTDSRGRRRLDDESIAVLETVKHLRDEDCGYATIRRRIGPVADESPVETASSPPPTGPETVISPPFDTSAIVAEVVAAIRGENELAEKYARATYTMGQQEERIANLTAQLEETRQKVAALEAPKPAAEGPLSFWQRLTWRR